MHRTLLAFAIAAICSVDSSGEPIRCKGHTSGVASVSLSPDGTLAVSCDKSEVRVWNTRDGSEVRSLPVVPSENSQGYISDVLFAPDGQSIAVAASQQPITFWDAMTWQRRELTLPVSEVAYSLAYSPDGAELAVAENAAVRVWKLADAALAHDIKFNGLQIGRAWRVAYSPDGLMLAAALHDYGGSWIPKEPKVRVWNAHSGDIVFTARNHWSASGVAFSPDSRLLASIGDGVELWDVTVHARIRRISENERGILCLAFSPDGVTLAVGGNDPAIKLWDVKSGRLVGILAGHTGQVHDICFSKDGKTLASAGTDKLVLIWNLATDTTEEQEP